MGDFQALLNDKFLDVFFTSLTSVRVAHEHDGLAMTVMELFCRNNRFTVC
jgi:hypothetical protein